MTDAEGLRARLTALAKAIALFESTRHSPRQQKLAGESIALIELQLRKLDGLIAHTTHVPEDKVYLSVWSLNKGFQEIGGEWQDDAHLSHMATAVTQRAYELVKVTRPNLSRG
jgi:hypothetical protein